MNRLHLHFAVWDLDASAQFYSRLFCKEPDVRHNDYAKWMVDDPPMNFALSQASESPGFRHAGIQSEDEAGFKDLQRRADHTGLESRDESDAHCCYARSDKRWISDPDGVSWELFQTHEQLPQRDPRPEPDARGCGC